MFKMKMIINKRSLLKDYNTSSGFRGEDGVFFFCWLLCVVKTDVVLKTIFRSIATIDIKFIFISIVSMPIFG
ncbi:hypothetical protein HanIR_Chr04g0180111 [Helianthus annuus]|nr:hypothetical protein HanIR_Chr04g0180111 [Helianthus annuus]